MSGNNNGAEDAGKNAYPDYIEKVYEFTISPGQSPERIDLFLTRSILNATRAKVQKAIDNGQVSYNGKKAKPSKQIQPGDRIRCVIMKPPPIDLTPENIPLDIVYEDDSLLVVIKPPGMCTHPGFGNRYGTLVNAVLYYLGLRSPISVETGDDADIDEGAVFAGEGVRPGVVHRLDKNTSGLLIVSKNPAAHAKIGAQFAERTVEKFYYALVWGVMKEDKGAFEGAIGRSPRDRKLFAVVKRDGKNAMTSYEVVERFDFLTLVKIKLHTGRTHQIRVHFSHDNHPIFGDRDYGGGTVVFGGHKPIWKKTALDCLEIIGRQALHAGVLGFKHPVSNEAILLNAPFPEDMEQALSVLRKYGRAVLR